MAIDRLTRAKNGNNVRTTFKYGIVPVTSYDSLSNKDLPTIIHNAQNRPDHDADAFKIGGGNLFYQQDSHHLHDGTLDMTSWSLGKNNSSRLVKDEDGTIIQGDKKNKFFNIYNLSQSFDLLPSAQGPGHNEYHETLNLGAYKSDVEFKEDMTTGMRRTLEKTSNPFSRKMLRYSQNQKNARRSVQEIETVLKLPGTKNYAHHYADSQTGEVHGIECKRTNVLFNMLRVENNATYLNGNYKNYSSEVSGLFNAYNSKRTVNFSATGEKSVVQEERLGLYKIQEIEGVDANGQRVFQKRHMLSLGFRDFELPWGYNRQGSVEDNATIQQQGAAIQGGFKNVAATVSHKPLPAAGPNGPGASKIAAAAVLTAAAIGAATAPTAAAAPAFTSKKAKRAAAASSKATGPALHPSQKPPMDNQPWSQKRIMNASYQLQHLSADLDEARQSVKGTHTSGVTNRGVAKGLAFVGMMVGGAIGYSLAQKMQNPAYYGICVAAAVSFGGTLLYDGMINGRYNAMDQKVDRAQDARKKRQDQLTTFSHTDRKGAPDIGRDDKFLPLMAEAEDALRENTNRKFIAGMGTKLVTGVAAAFSGAILSGGDDGMRWGSVIVATALTAYSVWKSSKQHNKEIEFLNEFKENIGKLDSAPVKYMDRVGTRTFKESNEMPGYMGPPGRRPKP